MEVTMKILSLASLVLLAISSTSVIAEMSESDSAKPVTDINQMPATGSGTNSQQDDCE